MDVSRSLSDLRSFLVRVLANKFPYLIILAIIAGVGVTFIMDRLDYTVRAMIYIVPGILAVLFLLNTYRHGEKYPRALTLIAPYRKFFQFIFVVLFAGSILALYFSSTRPWYYFVLVTALFCIIFLQVMSDPQKPVVILFEISCVLGNLIFGLQLKYPFYFGLTDIIPHLYLSTVTLLSGHIIPVDLDYSYAWFPLYHIFIAEGTALLGTDIKTAFIILTSVSFIVLVWVVYLLFHQITKNVQTSLLICLFFSTTPVVITYSTYVVTRVMAFIAFVFFLLLAHKQIETSKWRSFFILTILFSLYLILVHQVSIIQILFLLVIFVCLEVLVHDYFAIKTKVVAFIIVTAATYWLYTSFFLTTVLLQTADSATVPKLSETMSQIIPGNEYIFLENNIPAAIVIFFVILGAGYLCWAYKSKYPAVIGLFALVASPLYFPSPLTASAMAMITFRIDRFGLLISPFIAGVLAIGFLVMLFTFYRISPLRKIVIVLGVIVFSFLCFSALTGENASDSRDLSPNQSRVYFTEPELNAFAFIPQYAASNSTISSDKFSTRMFEKKTFSETQSLGLPSYFTTSRLRMANTITYEDGYFILREEELERSGLGFESVSLDYAETVLPTPDNLGKFSAMSDASQKLYDNRQVSILYDQEYY
jgi:hypothetical protein